MPGRRIFVASIGFYATRASRTPRALRIPQNQQTARDMTASRIGIGLAASIVLVACPTAAWANDALVPPENSAAAQYTEAFPTAGGNKDVTKNNAQRPPTAAKALGSGNAMRLEAHGAEGEDKLLPWRQRPRHAQRRSARRAVGERPDRGILRRRPASAPETRLQGPFLAPMPNPGPRPRPPVRPGWVSLPRPQPAARVTACCGWRSSVALYGPLPTFCCKGEGPISPPMRPSASTPPGGVPTVCSPLRCSS